MEQDAHCIFTDCGSHAVEHLISAHLILYQRISLAICLEADTFTELIHIINMSHPFCIDYFQKNNTLDLTDLLCLRELCFLGFVKLCGSLLQHVL